jgi:hypothetical protein
MVRIITYILGRAWWCTSVIPAKWEAELGGSWFEAGLGKSKVLSEK